MLHFEKISIINAPVETVWRFYERPDILEKLTPFWQPVKVLKREGGLGIGAKSEFLLFFGFIPIKWIAEHIEYEQYQLFTDIQKSGPMQFWQHQHKFIDENGKTKLIDSIDFSLPGGFLTEILIGWWVKSQLNNLFNYRHQITKKECEV
jgi:ligand-binding SRPBCC domain-containing protein